MDIWKVYSSRTDAPICHTDPNGRIKRANAGFNAAFLTNGGSSPQSLFDCVGVEDRDTLQAALASVHEAIPNAEVECVNASDRSRWTRWHMTYIGDDEVVIFGRDVTDHRETAAALSAKEAHLASIIETEPECVKIVDCDGTLLEINAAGLRLVDAGSKGELIGHSVYDLVAPTDRERFRAFNERICAGERGELSFEVVGLSGHRRSVESVAVPLQYGAAENSVQLAITRDVTERLRLEDQVRQGQKMEALGRLAGGIAHDFNNLLTAILGSAELAQASIPADSPAAEDLRQIQSTAERAAHLTRQLLTFARRQVVTPESVVLEDLVCTIDEMLRRIIGERHTLAVASDTSSGAVFVDRGQLEQILVNLVVNARDAMPDGGRIDLHTREERVGADRASTLGLTAGRYGVVSVVDHGEGISEDTFEHMFEPFFTTKKDGGGTGLGLATCYGIASQAGGAITVRTDSRGSKFEVYFPSATTKPREAAKPGCEASGGSETILVVEDERLVRDITVRILRGLGYAVIEAQDAPTALRQIEDHPEVSLVVTDVMMPDMNGPALVEAMRERRPHDLGVLYITGYSPAHLVDDLRNDQYGGVLTKPFAKAQLAEAIRGVLDKYQ